MSREIRLVLKVDQEGNLTARLKDTATQAEVTEGKLRQVSETARKSDAELSTQVEKTNQKLKERSKLGGGAAGGGLGSEKPGGLAQILQSRAGGDVSKLMGGASKVAAIIGAYVVVTQALGKVGDAASILGNSSLSASQKMNMLAESLIPGASAVKRFVEGVTGVTESMRYQAQEHEVGLGRIAAQTAGARTIDAAQGRLYGAQGAVRSISDLPAAGADISRLPGRIAMRAYGPLRQFDRSTATGQREYEEYQRSLPAMDLLTRSNRATTAAQFEVNARASKVASLETEQDAARRRRDKAREKHQDLFDAEKQMGGTMAVRYKAERDKALKEAKEENQRVMDLEARKQTEINGLAEARVRLAQAESAARKANISVMQSELENLKAREALASGQAQKFGMMGAGGRMMALQAFKAVQEIGIENAPPELLQQAAGFAPKTLAKMAEKAGEGTAEYQAGKELAPEDFGGKDTIKELRAKIDKVQAEIRVEVDLDERTTGQEIAHALDGTLQKLIESINVSIRDAIIKIRNDQAMANNMNG